MEIIKNRDWKHKYILIFAIQLTIQILLVLLLVAVYRPKKTPL